MLFTKHCHHKNEVYLVDVLDHHQSYHMISTSRSSCHEIIDNQIFHFL